MSVRVPTLVKHVTMRIYDKGGVKLGAPPAWVPRAVGRSAEQFLLSFSAAVNSLVKQGHLGLGSSIDPAGKITLTGKGMLQNARHQFDNAGASSRFDALYQEALVAWKDAIKPPTVISTPVKVPKEKPLTKEQQRVQKKRDTVKAVKVKAVKKARKTKPATKARKVKLKKKP